MSFSMRSTSWTVFFLGLSGVAFAQETTSRIVATPEQKQATAAIHEYFRRTTRRLADDCLADVATLDDWQKRRPLLRAHLLEMLGLWPIPAKTALRATVTGTVEKADFAVEKLHFQSMPGLYVSANFYRPLKVTQPLPAILYLCGHSKVKIDGVSHGNKAAYQHHAAWYARHGYCCLILDTLELGEIEGIHHGTYREGMWWWAARGYTPAGVEAWNGVRALDYLETRPEVDKQRIGVTGRSGGGIYTWWLAAVDDRPACLVPVAGITDLENYIVDHGIERHCDCMFMVNTYGWDFAAVAALAAPRPVLFSNTDKDAIFPLDGVVRVHDKLRKIYRLYGATNKLGLLIAEGPHKDTQDLQVPAFRWMNRWLQDKNDGITRLADKPLDPKELKVFERLPADQRNTTIHETFVPVAKSTAPPRTKETWEAQRGQLLAALKEKSFRGWPGNPGLLDVKTSAKKEAGTLTLHVLEYTSEENLRLPITVVHGTKHAKPSILVVTVVDQAGWEEWLAALAPAFTDVLPGGKTVKPNQEAFQSHVQMMNRFDWAFATVASRGIGPNQWETDKQKDIHIRRRFLLLGKSVDEGRVWDVRRALAALEENSDWKQARLWIQGTGPSAGIALYAGLFEPRVERFDLHRPAVSHQEGPIFLNVLRVLDMPQAVALALPRPVVLYDTNRSSWEWTEAIAKLYDAAGKQPPLRFRKEEK